VIKSKLNEHLVNDQLGHSRFKHAQASTFHVRTAGPISGVFVGAVHFAAHCAIRGFRLAVLLTQ
jgi:hypothetical protein